MNRNISLGRQLALTMAGLTTMMLLLTVGAFYVSYWFLLKFQPSLLGPEDALLPNGTDLVLLFIIMTLGLAIATRVAFRMAIRIIAPISSVAQAARRVASGDLTARAEPAEHSLAEIAVLTDDFNAMAARLEKMAGDVVAWNAKIAHELRTPLQVLTGRLQGVSDGVFVADEKLILSLSKQVDGLARLVEDLRVVSLFDSGHLVLHRVEMNLAAEIDELALLVAPPLEAQGFWLSTSLDRGTVYVDPVRIRQALMALLDNARKHADQGPVSIKLELEPDRIRIHVTDSGPGIAPEFAEQAFNAFARGWDAHLSRGSGLGLSVVQAIMEAHGGLTYYDPSSRSFVLDAPRFPAGKRAR